MSADSRQIWASVRGVKVPQEYREMVALKTQPPSRSRNGLTSVPPPAKLSRRGALARMCTGTGEPPRNFGLRAFVIFGNADIDKKAFGGITEKAATDERGKNFSFEGDGAPRVGNLAEDAAIESVDTCVDEAPARGNRGAALWRLL